MFVHHFGEASFGELVPTGRYGELFRANKARFEEKWGVTWQPHLRRPNAWYRDLVERIREVVDRELPPDATVLVVSNGDDELLQLGADRRGWHFPQMEDGTYAGYHPGDSAEAIAHLEALCESGARVHPVSARRRSGGSTTTASSVGACRKVLLRSLLLGYAAYSASIRALPAEPFWPRQVKSPRSGCDSSLAKSLAMRARRGRRLRHSSPPSPLKRSAPKRGSTGPTRRKATPLERA